MPECCGAPDFAAESFEPVPGFPYRGPRLLLARLLRTPPTHPPSRSGSGFGVLWHTRHLALRGTTMRACALWQLIMTASAVAPLLLYAHTHGETAARPPAAKD